MSLLSTKCIQRRASEMINPNWGKDRLAPFPCLTRACQKGSLLTRSGFSSFPHMTSYKHKIIVSFFLISFWQSLWLNIFSSFGRFYDVGNEWISSATFSFVLFYSNKTRPYNSLVLDFTQYKGTLQGNYGFAIFEKDVRTRQKRLIKPDILKVSLTLTIT